MTTCFNALVNKGDLVKLKKNNSAVVEKALMNYRHIPFAQAEFQYRIL